MKRSYLLTFLILTGFCGAVFAGTDNSGDNDVSLIVGGSNVDPQQLQAVAALVPVGETQYETFYCSGVLVDSEWVLTAAHCVVRKNPHAVEIQMGNHHAEPGLGERHKVTEIFIHPDYIYDNVPDVALLHLETPSEYTPMPILTEEDAALAAPGINATASGWGSINQGSSYPVALQEVQLPIVSNDTCGSYSGKYPGWITDYEICAGYDNGFKDAAPGDSGGPLIVPDGDSWRTAGLTSWGSGDYYGVFARVTPVADWIQDLMDNNSTGE